MADRDCLRLGHRGLTVSQSLFIAPGGPPAAAVLPPRLAEARATSASSARLRVAPWSASGLDQHAAISAAPSHHARVRRYLRTACNRLCLDRLVDCCLRPLLVEPMEALDSHPRTRAVAR